MTPAKSSSLGCANDANKQNSSNSLGGCPSTSTTTTTTATNNTARYSILSDPRLSQLFALSSQLEALAHSVEVQPQKQPPVLPPKPSSLINNNHQNTTAAVPPPLPVKLNVGNISKQHGHGGGMLLGQSQDLDIKSSEVKYKRLRDHQDDEENNEIIERDIECGGDQNHPRYSTLSDSRMSTSSQGADSTPSANSVLSDSLLVQSADSLPETTTAATGLPLGSSGSQDEDDGDGGGLNGLSSPQKKNEAMMRPNSEAEWQARCIELELALQKFRDQAHNIRKLLRDKLSELEHRVVEAETRAEDAEGKVRLMERRLNEVEWSSTTSGSNSTANVDSGKQQSLYNTTTTTTSKTCNTENEITTDDKDRIIRSLETEVEAQRALRLADAKAVEAKAARIKDWVTNKLRELEDQNAHLKVQNAKANDQMELLRNRLEQLQVLGATTKSRQDSMAEQDSSLGSFEGDPIASQDSLTDIAISSSKTTTTSNTPHKRKSTASPNSRGPQRSSIEASSLSRLQSKMSPAAAPCGVANTSELNSTLEATQRVPAAASSSTTTAASNSIKAGGGHHRDSRVDSGSVDLETPLELSPKSPLEVLDETLTSVMRTASAASPIPPPRSRNNQMAAQAAAATSNTTQPLCSTNGCPTSRVTKGRSESDCELRLTDEPQSYDTLPDRHKSLQMPLAPLPVTKKLTSTAKKAHLMMSDEVHDYSEIYTPSTEVKGVIAEDSGGPTTTASTTSMSSHSHCASSLDTAATSAASKQHPQPPPPPMHRYPSWENRIYQVASEGIQDLLEDSSRFRDSKNNNGESGFGSDINVPVYATVKGRASQIRSVPFTGDSSDSDSDNGGEIMAGNSKINHHHEDVLDGVLRDASFDSDLSNDYAVPPDATSTLIPSTPSRILMASENASLASPRKSMGGIEKALEKSGYLTKLGGKIKSWKKRYFMLKNGTLCYWKSQHDVHRKPQGLIILDEKCQVSRAVGANTFEIATENKTYYLTADSQPLMEDWVRVLQNVVQRNALKLLLSREDGVAPTLQGWLTKVKHGHSRKVWCLLIGKMFVYFKNPNDTNPAGQINMRDSRVEEVEHISSDSDSDETEVETRTKEPTLGIFPNHVQQGPTYLIFPSKNDKEQWLYHLTVVSGGDPKAGTALEQLIQKLMEEDGNPQSVIWRHPLMTYSKDPISTSLTTFTSEELQNEALKLFKSLLLFTNVIMDSAGIDYHVMLAGNVFQQCLDNPGLQEELLCALCKQTSRIMTQSSKHGVQSFLMNATQLFACDGAIKSPPGSGMPSIGTNGTHSSHSTSTSSSASTDKSNPPTHVFIQGWMLMSLAISIFVPKSSKLLWFLRTHFAKNKDSRSECGKYAAYCSRALERAVTIGPRQARPSRMEVLSILLKNPHHHSLPHALPVHFANETYQVVGFDGSTTIGEFLNDLNQELGLRSVDQSGFTLFSDDPLDKDLYHALLHEDKVCDVISKWETALREKGMGKFENNRVIRFVYQNRLFWRKNISSEVERERLLFAYQISKQIVQGKFPINKELAFELTALMAQIHFGDLNLPEKTSSSSSGISSGGSSVGAQKQSASEALEKFFPPRYMDLEVTNSDPSVLESYLIEKWASLRGKSVHDCVRIYLTCTRKWQFFGAQLFQVQIVKDDDPSSLIWLAIHEDGVSLLELQSMQPLVRYSYENVVTFGGCQEDFMLVVTSEASSDVDSIKRGLHLLDSDRASSEDSAGTTKLLFNAGKPQILQITLLIADYMNMIGRTAPGTLSMPATPKSRMHTPSRSSSRAGRGILSAHTTAPNTPRPDHRDINATPRLSRKWSHLASSEMS